MRYVVAIALVVAVAGCGSDPTSEEAAEPTAAERLVDLDVDAFAERLEADGEAVVINVHVPFEGEIEGTDLHLPYDTILDEAELPPDVDRPVLLYCESDNMSTIAGEALLRAGYADVAHLDGGMVAWESAGRPLVDRAPAT
jgi:rhodanese-related sulfurtransferase